VSGRQRLDAIVRMVGLPRRALLRVEATMRRAQPAVGDGRVRIGRAEERELPAIRIEDAEDQEQVGVGGG